MDLSRQVAMFATELVWAPLLTLPFVARENFTPCGARRLS